MRDDDDIMATRDVADALRVSPKTVRRWIRAGLLECDRTLGGHNRIRKGDVRAFLLEHYTGNTEGLV